MLLGDSMSVYRQRHPQHAIMKLFDHHYVTIEREYEQKFRKAFDSADGGRDDKESLFGCEIYCARGSPANAVPTVEQRIYALLSL